MLGETYLRELIERISMIPHVRWLRIGTKAPIDNPCMVTDKLLSIFERSRKPILVVTQANLPVEIDNETIEAISKIRKTGTAVLHQHAVLKGVNDDAQTLFELYMRLLEIGITNMYVFHPMPVFGAIHFQPSFLQPF